jgi:hypothetical protein
MKNYYHKIVTVLILAGLSLTSCEDLTSLYEGPDFVAFQQRSITIDEVRNVVFADGTSQQTPATAVIEIFRSTVDLSNPLTVNFSVQGIFVDDSDFYNAGDNAAGTFNISHDGSIVIPAGQPKASITVTSINDEDATGNRRITLTITGTSDAKFNLGYPGGNDAQSMNVTVIDDDCPFDIAEWLGTYNVSRTLYGTTAGAISVATFTVTATADPNDRFSMYIANVFNNVNVTQPTSLKLTFVPCPGIVLYDQGTKIGDYLGTSPTFVQREDFQNRFAINGIIKNPGNLGDWGSFNEEFTTLEFYGRVFVPGVGGFGSYKWELSKTDD